MTKTELELIRLWLIARRIRHTHSFVGPSTDNNGWRIHVFMQDGGEQIFASKLYIRAYLDQGFPGAIVEPAWPAWED